MDRSPPPPPPQSPTPFSSAGSVRESLRSDSFASASGSGVQEILRSVVAMGGSEPRTLRQANTELQSDVDRLRAELDAARQRIAELEGTETRLHEYEEEMALHLDHADEQARTNESLTEGLETQNRRALKLWKAHQESEGQRATLQGDLEQKVEALQLLRTHSHEIEAAHSSLHVQHVAAMTALRKFEEGPDQQVLSELVEELQATVTMQQEDLELARKDALALTRELQEHKRQHDADMQGCDLAVEAATKALEAAREAQKDAEERLAPAEAAVAAGLERERVASRMLATIEADMRDGGVDPEAFRALKKENAELRARVASGRVGIGIPPAAAGDGGTGQQGRGQGQADGAPEPEPEPPASKKPASGNWKKVQMLSKSLPKSQSGMPIYQTKRLVAQVMEKKVLDDAKLGTVAERTPFASFFRDWVHQQYGLKETADQKILAIVKTVRTHGATKLYHKANTRTAGSKYDARLWVFGQLTGITDSYAQSLVNKGADDGSAELAVSLAARRGLADYMIDLIALLYEGNQSGIDESMGDGKRGDDGWLPAAHVRRALQQHFETCAPPSELPGASGFTSKQGWTSPYGSCTLHVRGIPKDSEGDAALAALFRPFGHYVQGTVRQRSATIVDGVEVAAASWALVTFLDPTSVEKLLAAQAQSPLLAGEAEKVALSCQSVDIEKASTSTGAPSAPPRPRPCPALPCLCRAPHVYLLVASVAISPRLCLVCLLSICLSVCLSVSGAFGKTWRKGKAKAAAEITRLLTLQEQGELQLPGGAGVASPADASLQAWVEPAGPRSLTVMELSEDLDNMAKTGNEIKKAVGSAGEKGSKGGGGGGAKKGGSGAAAGGAGSAGRKKMLQVDEVMALVIGSLLASQ